MLLIPFHKIEIHSSLSPDEIINKLSPRVANHQPWFRSLHGKADFIGKINNKKIKLVPVTKGRNTYLPLITGKIVTEGGSSVLKLAQYIHPVAIFVVIAFAIVPILLGFDIYKWLTLMFAFHAFMCISGFWPEAKKSEQHLKEIYR
jgi:hypothetical protein